MPGAGDAGGTSIPYLGEGVALLTALAWGFAVILFKKSGEKVHPIALNLFKNTLAGLLFIPTIYLFGQSLFYPASTNDYLLLLASGALGIGISDTLFFKCLNLLGAGLTAIVDCLYSPSIIILSMLWLGESLSLGQTIGVVMIISAVLAVTGKAGAGPVSRHDLMWGIIYGAVAMGVMAVGIVMIKPLLERSPLVWVTEIRLLGGLIVLAVALALHPGRRSILASIGSVRGWGYTLGGSLVGAYLSMILWLAGMKLTQASVAAALNQSSNVFIFVFAALFLKEPLTRRRLVGIGLGVAGSLLVTFC
jgi:drug/metabolite transporter (DMT)-like permease